MKSVHDSGVVHRDVGPTTSCSQERRVRKQTDIKLVILAVLRIWVTPSSMMRRYLTRCHPPEVPRRQGCRFTLRLRNRLGPAKPDLFDAFSCGMVILQVACPGLRKESPAGLGGILTFTHTMSMLGAHPSRSAASDFAILDEDGGKGWDLVCGLLAQRNKRSVKTPSDIRT